MDHQEVLRFRQRSAELTLSAALRRGARARPQARGRLFKEGRSCALGAIYEAACGGPGDGYLSMFEALLALYPELENEWCEVADRSHRVLIREIYRRNDAGKSREAIADWLATMGY